MIRIIRNNRAPESWQTHLRVHPGEILPTIAGRVIFSYESRKLTVAETKSRGSRAKGVRFVGGEWTWIGTEISRLFMKAVA